MHEPLLLQTRRDSADQQQQQRPFDLKLSTVAPGGVSGTTRPPQQAPPAQASFYNGSDVASGSGGGDQEPRSSKFILPAADSTFLGPHQSQGTSEQTAGNSEGIWMQRARTAWDFCKKHETFIFRSVVILVFALVLQSFQSQLSEQNRTIGRLQGMTTATEQQLLAVQNSSAALSREIAFSQGSLSVVQQATTTINGQLAVLTSQLSALKVTDIQTQLQVLNASAADLRASIGPLNALLARVSVVESNSVVLAQLNGFGGPAQPGWPESAPGEPSNDVNIHMWSLHSATPSNVYYYSTRFGSWSDNKCGARWFFSSLPAANEWIYVYKTDRAWGLHYRFVNPNDISCAEFGTPGVPLSQKAAVFVGPQQHVYVRLK